MLKSSFMEPIYLQQARTELTEHLVYATLANHEKNPGNKEVLEKLSRQEQQHYEFWKTLLPADGTAQSSIVKPYAFTVFFTPLLRTIFGATFVAKLLEKNEVKAVATYEHLLLKIPASHQAQLRAIIEDEKTHELALIGQLQEKRIDYLGFIVLGLADAIVEITGVHAGFLGVTGETLIAGIAGVIVGFAAAISMGSASYLQAKQDTNKSPFISALATGLSYFFSVILLAFPYFLIRSMVPAFIISTSIGLILVALFSFYGAIIFDRKFWREFGEAATLMLATAGATFILGTLLGKAFHLKVNNF
jgi:VIT1/CCC1 family predicted Fe2+/Mn2+ transporter